MPEHRGSRWQTVYDSDGLKKAIAEIVAELRSKPFYVLERLDDPPVCSGDIVRLECDIPYIDENGDVVTTEGDGLWLVIGNTCDFARDINEVTWTQVVPLVAIDDSKISGGRLNDLLQYKLSRRFYVPAWPVSPPPKKHYFADFLRTVPIHRNAFGGHAKVLARMTEFYWVLLHSCLVRFLARDDGRFDPG
jgi:hypothetical protein